MPVLLILVVAAAVELAALIAVGKAIGVLATIGLLVLGSVVGALLLRREGARTLAAFHEAVRTRRPPHRELADGVLIAAAGVLIVLPGFVSDVFGLLLLLPPTRSLVRGRMLRSAAQRSAAPFTPGGIGPGAMGHGGMGPGGMGNSGMGPGGLGTPGPDGAGQGGTWRAAGGYDRGDVIEGEVVEGPVYEDTERS